MCKSFKDSLAKRFTHDLRIPLPHHGSCKVMKMHLHSHELRLTRSPVFFLRALFLSSLFVSMVTVKLTPVHVVWGKYQNSNQTLLIHTAAKSCSFRSSDGRVTENSCNWWQFRDLL